MTPTIRIDDEVYAWLQDNARPFEDTPNSVLRRVAKLETTEKITRIPLKKEKVTRRAQGEKTPQKAFHVPILKVLKQNDGSGDRMSVLGKVEKLMAGQLTELDTSDIDSGSIRWQKSAEWEVRVMREEGLLKPVAETPRGVWALTESGFTAASSL